MNKFGKAYCYMLSQLTAKSIAAAAQFYSIYVFTKILSASDAALIFLIFGYVIWIQVFEFGLSQVIQNKYNARRLSVTAACQIIVVHFAIVATAGVGVVCFPEILRMFLGGQLPAERNTELLSFSVGIALILVATNNVLIQRFLLIINQSLFVSKLIFLQALISIVVLLYFQLNGSSIQNTIFIYLLIPVLTYVPILVTLARKAWRGRSWLNVEWWSIIKSSTAFWGLTVLSSIYLGADYFYAAKYLSGSELISYHFSSRIFFISFVTYFSYLQYVAKNISSKTFVIDPKSVWGVAAKAVIIGEFSVFLVLAVVIVIYWMGGFNLIGAMELMDLPLVLSAAFYYGVRVIRDVGVVVVWNLGSQRLLYVVHAVELVSCLTFLNLFTPRFGGEGIFAAMAFAAIFGSALIYFYLISRKYKKLG